MAYSSNESGRDEIYIQPFMGEGGKLQVSTNGGSNPVWSRDGRELFYLEGDKFTTVSVTTEPMLVAQAPKLLFEGRYYTYQSFDVSPDGQRFLVIEPTETLQAANQINVVINWFEDLKHRVPNSASN